MGSGISGLGGLGKEFKIDALAESIFARQGMRFGLDAHAAGKHVTTVHRCNHLIARSYGLEAVEMPVPGARHLRLLGIGTTSDRQHRECGPKGTTHPSLVFLSQRQPSHLLANGNDGESDKHQDQRGYIVTTFEVVDALQEKEQGPANEQDRKHFEKVIAHGFFGRGSVGNSSGRQAGLGKTPTLGS